MGYQKFKLSDMIPNAWFYKLKDLSKQPQTHSHSLSSTTTTTTKAKKHHHSPPPAHSPPSSTAKTTSPSPPLLHSQPRKSYHFTRDLPLPPPEDPPKTSSRSRKPTRKNTDTAARQNQFSLSSSVSDRCTCRDTATLQSHRSKTPESDANVENAPPKTAEHFDIVIDFDNYKYNTPGRPGTHLNSGQLLESLSTKSYKNNGFDFQLPRIITKPKQSTTQEEKPVAPVTSRRFSGSSPAGVRLRINSPRIMGMKQGQNGKNGSRRSVKKRRNLSESFAVVKSSDDPQRDFRESMVEMIVQNNLRASKDLEDLLACYLLLNSDEYHAVIIKVFKQIWYDLSRLRDQKLVS